MQWYERSDMPRPPSARVQAPISLISPNGQLCIGLSASSTHGAPHATDTHPAAGMASVQLLYPITAHPAPRWWLRGVLLMDVALLVYIAETSWREYDATRIAVLALVSLAADAFGACACELRRPELLGLFAVIVSVQLLGSVLVLLTTVRRQ